MNTVKTEGIIIKRRNVGEADRILTVYTKTEGKILIKAKGVRKITSRRSSHIELLNYTKLTLHKGKTMPILTEAQITEDFSSIKDDLKKTGFAYHVCELIDGLCAENQENTRVFFLLKRILDVIALGEDISAKVYLFETELLKTLGFYPNRVSIQLNTAAFIEQILERKLRSKQLLSHFS